MTAYYNEIEPFAAQWLRNLINAGHIAPGIVDERSIEDVYPSDLRGFTQCHFFAGIGVWSHALRSAGWSDDRPVWTGSCPCQPFSAAGQGAGFVDERHLWPHFHHLIQECRPAIVLGEQVASKDADPWIDLVCDDLEAMGYSFGAVPFPSAGVGAPHIRDRLYWMANANGGARGKGRAHLRGRSDGGNAKPRPGSGGSSMPDRLANDRQHGRIALPIDQGHDSQHHAEPCGESGRLGNTYGIDTGRDRRNVLGAEAPSGGVRPIHGHLCDSSDMAGRTRNPGPVNGFWFSADWLLCRDGKWRAVEPGTFPLAHGAAARVGRLRAYGNAINAKAAQVFIECVMDCIP